MIRLYIPFLVAGILIIGCNSSNIQFELTKVETETSALIIGLQALNDSIIWASGTNATVLRSTDGGTNWEKFQYKQADTLQFRDIHPISAQEAIVVSSGQGMASQILYFHTKSGWTKTFQMEDSTGFLDAIQLWDNGQGLVYGDAIDSLAYILKTVDFGQSWKRIPTAPLANKGEGGFASSGSNIALAANGEAWIATGAGGSARVFYSADYGRSWQTAESPMMKGDAAGITAIKAQNANIWITGGDLAISDSLLSNLYRSADNGKNWVEISGHLTMGSFYGLAVSAYENAEIILVCGPNGADLHLGDSNTWHNISNENIWTATFINPQTALMAGRDGKMFRLKLQ